MDATTIDQEFQQLQTEFQDVAATVQSLATKLQAAQKAGDTNATEWLADLEKVAHDIDDEQAQVQKLLLAIHDFVGSAAQEKPPLFAPGQEPQQTEPPPQQQGHGMLGGMMGGGMFGGYYGGGFGRAMEMGMAMNLGANLVNSIFR
jgi:hypothetical protein